jgi:hypothetical protein
MQEGIQKLSQENMQLKAGAQEGMAKIAVQKQANDQKAMLDKLDAEREAQLSRWRAEREIELKQLVANADYDIEQRKLDQQREEKAKQMKFDQDCHAQEMSEKVRVDNEAKATELAPQLITTLKDALKEFAGAILESNHQLQTSLIEQMKKPKRVTLGEIKRNADGSPAGANVTVQ